MESKGGAGGQGLDTGEKMRTAACAALLVAINAAITGRLFRIDYLNQMGSIEAAFIGLARYIREHFPDLHWFPLWYGGIPFPDAYPPLLHFTVAGVSALFHISAGLAYHAVTAAIYCLGPAALFWAMWRLGAARSTAFACALLYSLISPSCWLVREIRADSGGWFGPRRLVTMVRYGEGPHVASLLFLPLAIGLLHAALRKRRPLDYLLAAAACAAVVLSNWIGGFALALAAAAYVVALGGWWRAAAVGAYAYALALPWVTPSTFATIRANAPLVGGRFTPNLKLELVFAAGFILLAWLLARAAAPPRVRFALLFLYGTAFLAMGGYWFDASLLPQPKRYHLEMDMAFWMAAALCAPEGIAWIRARFIQRQPVAQVSGFAESTAPLRSRLHVGGTPRTEPRPSGSGLLAHPLGIVALAGCVGCGVVLVHQRRLARELEQRIDIRSTAEYEISTWLRAHLPGRRVFAPGTIGFWMNAFSDTPMLVGGFDNGIRNTMLQDVNYQIYAGNQQQIMLDFLEAFGCDAIVGSGPQSREVYHPYAHPEKFVGMKELWRDGPEVIYAVPGGGSHSTQQSQNRFVGDANLAHVVARGNIPATRPPGYDSSALAPYLRALRDPAIPPASFRWTSQHSAEIHADMRPEQLLSVQVTWDQGWQARVNGEPRRISADGLGQMAIAPRCSGSCTVELSYDGGAEMRTAVWVSRLAWGGGVAWILLWRRRSGSVKKS